MNKTKQKITEKMLIAEVIERFPDLAEILTEEYGFHCVGCFAAQMETLEDGARVHGMGDDEIKVMVENLNEIVESQK